MHEWHTNTSKNPLTLIREFMGFEFDTDYGGRQEVTKVRMADRTFSSSESARNFITNASYGGNIAYMAACVPKKLSKAYQNAYSNFITRYNEYKSFKDALTIAYGRKSEKATCPNCGSSINLKYGKSFKVCPVCGSRKIISDSNWKILDTKCRMAEKAAENLAKEAEKNDVTFICGIEWHC